MTSSGQWCLVHNCHQDDPRHAYDESVCEGHHRDTGKWEEIRVRLSWLRTVIEGRA